MGALRPGTERLPRLLMASAPTPRQRHSHLYVFILPPLNRSLRVRCADVVLPRSCCSCCTPPHRERRPRAAASAWLLLLLRAPPPLVLLARLLLARLPPTPPLLCMHRLARLRNAVPALCATGTAPPAGAAGTAAPAAATELAAQRRRPARRDRASMASVSRGAARVWGQERTEESEQGGERRGARGGAEARWMVVIRCSQVKGMSPGL